MLIGIWEFPPPPLFCDILEIQQLTEKKKISL